MAERKGGLLRRVLSYLQDAPPETSLLKEADARLRETVRRARDECAQATAASARSRLELQRLQAEAERLMQAALDQQRNGLQEPLRETAAQILSLRQRAREAADHFQRREERARLLQGALRRLEEQSRHRLEEARSLAPADALPRLRAAEAELSLRWRRDRDEADAVAPPDGLQNDLPGQAPSWEQMSEFRRKVRERMEEEALQAILQEVRQLAASSSEEPASKERTSGAPTQGWEGTEDRP